MENRRAFASLDEVCVVREMIVDGNVGGVLEFLDRKGLTGGERLMDHVGIEHDDEDFWGLSMLHYVSDCPDEDKAVEMANAMLARGCEVDVTDYDDITPFMMACTAGFARLAAFLLDRGANGEAERLVDGDVAMNVAELVLATARDKHEMMRLLVDRVPRLFSRESGTRYLFEAVVSDQKETVRVLMEAGALPDDRVRAAASERKEQSGRNADEIAEMVAHPERALVARRRVAPPAVEKEM